MSRPGSPVGQPRRPRPRDAWRRAPEVPIVLDDFVAALASAEAALPGGELLPERLARAAARALPVDGASISLAFAPDRRLPLGASDDPAALAERLQFTVGEGPCLTTQSTGERVAADEAELGERWPVYTDELATRTPFRAVLSLPLADDFRGMGALDLYLAPPRRVGDVRLSDALAVATAVAAALSAPVPVDPERGYSPAWLDSPAAERRALVWQAIGYVNASLDVSSVDALSLLRAYAYGHGRDLDDVAQAVLDQQLPVPDLTSEADTAP